MRDDMKKVLVTRPRLGSRLKNGAVRALRRERIYEDSEPSTKSGMKPTNRKYSERKYLNEYLNPLIRFLGSVVGRPWDKIHSEIREKSPSDSAVGAHIYQHLWDYVERRPVWKDGVVGRTGWHGWRPLEAKQGQGWNEFYVDKHGILQRSPAPKKREKKADPNVRKISDLEFYIRREDGVWFFLRVEPQLWGERPSCIDPARMNRYLTNPGLARIPDGLSFTIPHRHSLMEFRTVSKKEKKKAGL